jgi:hypothetical protein
MIDLLPDFDKSPLPPNPIISRSNGTSPVNCRPGVYNRIQQIIGGPENLGSL